MLTQVLTRVPTYDELHVPSLQALQALGGSATIAEHVAKFIELNAMSDDVIAQAHGNTGRTELEYRLAWSRTALKRAGFVENSARGVWSVTPAGEMVAPDGVLRAMSSLRQQDRAGRQAREAVDQEVAETTGESPTSWKAQLLARLRTIPPAGFERLCQRLLRESGFTKVEVTGKTGDGGIDGTGILQVNLISFPVIFQCKRYSESVGPSHIREFRGAMMGRTDKGLFITTGSFSASARAEATRDGAPSIELIDGDQFCEHLKRLDMGTRVKLVEQVELVEGWFDDI